MPCRLKEAASSREISSSSTGTMRGSTSTIVTLEPKRAYIDANSTPTAPEPMTTSDFGTSESSSIPVEERTVFSSMSMPGQRARRGARGDEDVLPGVDRLGAVGARDRDLARTGQAAEPGGDVDPVLLHQVRDAVGRLADDLLLVLQRRRHVEPDLARRHAHLGAVAGLLEEVGRVEEGLGRDAAPERADAAQPRLLLDDQDRQAELRGADRGDVAAGARADDDDVVGLRRAHVAISLRKGRKSIKKVESRELRVERGARLRMPAVRTCAGSPWSASSLLPGCGGEGAAERQGIKVGFFGALTGPTATFAQSGKNGAMLAVAEINARGRRPRQSRSSCSPRTTAARPPRPRPSSPS